jgi:hypothetical protein
MVNPTKRRINVKRIALLAVVGAGLLVVPGTATARTDCGYAGGGPAQVYTSGGVTGDALVGACLDTNTAVDGGYVEIGNGSRGTYAVVDGSDSNPSNAAGYGALSTYEAGSKDTSCDGVDSGSGTNSGGCLWIKALNLGAPVPLIACGLTSGPDYAAASRDGCSI